MVNSEVVNSRDEESGVDESCDDRYGLNEHYKLRKLQASIEFCWQQVEISNHHTEANTISEAEEQHVRVPSHLIIAVMMKLNEGGVRFIVKLNLQVTRIPFMNQIISL